MATCPDLLFHPGGIEFFVHGVRCFVRGEPRSALNFIPIVDFGLASLQLQRPICLFMDLGSTDFGANKLLGGYYELSCSQGGMLFHGIFLNLDVPSRVRLHHPLAGTIFHELAHAAQAEKVGSPAAWKDYVRRQRAIPYVSRPMEVEARNFAASSLRKFLACV